MRRKHAVLPAAAMLVLAGCIDDHYDLSDIDTTSQFRVTDLQLPLNLSPITLGDIISLDDDSRIKVVTVDGSEIYALTESGSFSSDAIRISPFTVASGHVTDAHLSFALNSPAAPRRGLTAAYTLRNGVSQAIHASADNIDASIEGIDEVLAENRPCRLSISFDLKTELPQAISFAFTGLEMTIPRGLHLVSMPSGQSYDPATGRLHIDRLECPDHMATLSLTASGLDLRQAGISVQGHSLRYDTQVSIDATTLSLTADPSQLSGFQMPQEVAFDVHTSISDFDVSAITGTMQYALQGDILSIAPVTLTDIPDFLAQPGTDLRLANPQVYLSLTNPMHSNNITFSTGVRLSSVHGDTSTPYTLDDNRRITIGSDRGNGPYNYLLSPKMPTDILPAYAAGLRHYPFTSLGDVLSGDGLPQEIRIDLLEPQLPSQHVERSPLGVTYPGVEGSYDLLAPLALKAGDQGAVIVYSDTEDGWGSDDLDKLVIESLTVEADATSTMPLGADITAVPIDRQGNPVRGTAIKGARIEAGAQGQHIVITVEGQVRNLDGIRFEAVVRPGSDRPLAPDMTISLANLRARVSGVYTTDF